MTAQQIPHQMQTTDLAKSCDVVASGCTAIAGVVASVIHSSEALRDRREELKDVARILSDDQQKVSEASDEARLLSEKAFTQLGEGEKQIRRSLEQIGGLLELVDDLTNYVSDFGTAMEQVRRSSTDIGQIAETTSILALNASIEASRAEVEGENFASVAAEMKKLAARTSHASAEITDTIGLLETESQAIIGRIRNGETNSARIKSAISDTESSLGTVTRLIEQADKRNDVVSKTTSRINRHADQLAEAVVEMAEIGSRSDSRLQEANAQLIEIEGKASDALDMLAHIGLAQDVAQFGESCVELAGQLTQLTENALNDGSLSEQQLFDRNYRLVPGSKPERFQTGFSNWAERNWRPFFDAATSADEGTLFVVAHNEDGWLPAHISYLSRDPTGDLAHDERFCYNGRIVQITHSKLSEQMGQSYRITTFRNAKTTGNDETMRCASVPLVFRNRAWGNLILGYGMMRR